ncbi:unnamed protein product [Meganyctiphanes norvegica]|uniref:RING-type domain-containing protein n=1 Tax=Meganyctiphanes norvegica TaxID=48144 RepID=A0AAV2Q0C9_MEGNR
MDYFNKMDGAGGFVRAGLLGLSQGVSLHDPLRLHHALHSQSSGDMKDSGSGTGLLRPLSDYAHLPLLPFSAPHFFPHHLDPRLPFTSSAFHPLHAHEAHARAHDAHAKLPPPPTVSLSGSAFSPLPAKTAKLEGSDGPGSSICPVSLSSSVSSGLFSPALLASLGDHRTGFMSSAGGPSDDRRDSPSPRGSHGSRESPAHARDTDTPNSCSDEAKGRKARPGESLCPVCGVSLRNGDLEPHLTQELEKLARLPQLRPITQRGAPTTSTSASTASSSSVVTSSQAPSVVIGGPLGPPLSPHLPPLARTRDPGWDTYQRVRANRQVRLRAKKRRSGRGDELDSGHACPVCGDRVSSNPEDLHAHVESCLRRVSFKLLCQNGEDEVVDVEGDGPYEEYEWCGQRRVRISSALLRNQAQERREDKDSEMRSGSGEGNENGGGRGEPMSLGSNERGELEALKEKVRSLERDGGPQPQSKFSCLVCQGEYERPAVSVVCWHVLCEACWAHSLGAKGECPQCSHSVVPEDLRPIHL